MLYLQHQDRTDGQVRGGIREDLSSDTAKNSCAGSRNRLEAAVEIEGTFFE